MKTLLLFCLVAGSVLTCCAQKNTAIVPLADKLQDPTQPGDAYLVVWEGTSLAYRHTDKGWERSPEYDYTFSVVQRRYATVWKSIKNLHRLHPNYDGRAGARSQTMYFELGYAQAGNGLATTINSSLGNGSGKSDTEFREQTLSIDYKDAGGFTPYNKIKITQHYDYENGLLRETVELFKEKNGVVTPFMKNEETALFFRPVKLNGPPTVFGK
jgi:hypothetical protein